MFMSNGWTRLWLLIAASVLCVAILFLLGTPHFSVHNKKRLPLGMTITDADNIQPRSPALRITNVVQHGRIVEIEGTSDAGTVVMINGQRVASIFPDNSFRHFVGPLPRGRSILSVTCQDENGGVKTQQLAITLE